MPADDPNGDIARNVSTDKGMYREKHLLPSMPCPAIKVGTQRVAFVIPSPRPRSGIMDMHQSPRAIGGTLKDLRLTSLRVVRSAIQFRGVMTGGSDKRYLIPMRPDAVHDRRVTPEPSVYHHHFLREKRGCVKILSCHCGLDPQSHTILILKTG